MDSAFRMRLPATSANLGAAFDCAAVALNRYLDIQAVAADQFSITASGRDSEQCSRLEGNLVLGIYKELLRSENRTVTPLALRMDNGIPLGMGCGSSAAGRLAAIALAVHFGSLGWSSDRILAEASKLEGHPDNVAACWLGGFVTAASEGEQVYVARVEPPSAWRALVVMPEASVATSRARAVLPDAYSRADVVANLQAVSLLGLAFAQANAELLRPAMADRIHQPFREEICPLLPLLLPLVGKGGISGVALSGAGPSVLLIVSDADRILHAKLLVEETLRGQARVEILVAAFENSGAAISFTRI